MDKAQKQLIDTYYRKRNIAAEQNEMYYLNKSEAEYLINHPEMLSQFKDGDRLNDNVSIALLKYSPDKEATAKYIGHESTNSALYNSNYLLNDGDKENAKKMAEFILKYRGDNLYSHDVANIVAAVPELLTPEQILSKSEYMGEWDIAKIIANKPEMINHYDTSRLNVSNINQILALQPNLYIKFKDKISKYEERAKNDLIYKMKGNEYASSNPEKQKLMTSRFYKVLSKNSFYFNLLKDRLDGYDKEDLLIMNPKLADYLNLSNLSKYNISDILIKQPALFNKLDTNKFDRFDIVDLMKKQPLLVNYFGADSINNWDVIDIVKIHPELFDKFDISKFSSYNLKELIVNHPDLLDKIGADKFNEYTIVDAIIEQPKLASKFDLSKLHDIQIAKMVSEQPKVIKYLSKEILDKLDSYDIRDLIIKHPSLVNSLDLNKLRKWDVSDILSKRPKLVNSFDIDSWNRWDREDLFKSVPKIKQYINHG